ncbi:MAG TPA: PDZ domain-containing protein [Polyangiaceae bacterium]|nr:PDZ domain-containing protein [Polyangiaceae bacterium]
MTSMHSAGLGLMLWMFGKLLLVGMLILMHLARRRLHAVPAPLFDRRAAIRKGTRLWEGFVGLGAAYALCATVHFVSLVGQPTSSTLILNPIDGGPAARAGLLPGDSARSVEGTPVKSFEEFRHAVERGPEVVSIEVERKGSVVPLRIQKDGDRIGVASVPGEPLGAAAALARALPAPAVFMARWATASVRLLSGHTATELAGPVTVGVATSHGGGAWSGVLALLLSKDLAIVAVVYIVVLTADARSRSRFQMQHAVNQGTST